MINISKNDSLSKLKNNPIILTPQKINISAQHFNFSSNKKIKPKSEYYSSIEYNTNQINQKLNETDSSNNSGKFIFIQKLLLALTIYLQLFILFFTLSLLKLYEEFFKTKKIFCENKYSLFKDMTIENQSEISNSQDNLIFSSGFPYITQSAFDELLNFPLKKFAKIERIVEISRGNDEWILIGNNSLRGNKDLEYNYPLFDIYENNVSNEFSFNEKLFLEFCSSSPEGKIFTYTFPKFFSKRSLGKVNLYIN